MSKIRGRPMLSVGSMIDTDEDRLLLCICLCQMGILRSAVPFVQKQESPHLWEKGARGVDRGPLLVS